MKSTINQLGFLLIPTLYLARSVDWATVPAALKKKDERVLPLADKSFQAALNKHIKIALGTMRRSIRMVTMPASSLSMSNSGKLLLKPFAVPLSIPLNFSG